MWKIVSNASSTIWTHIGFRNGYSNNVKLENMSAITENRLIQLCTFAEVIK